MEPDPLELDAFNALREAFRAAATAMLLYCDETRRLYLA